jgi:hypothetical protein
MTSKQRLEEKSPYFTAAKKRGSILTAIYSRSQLQLYKYNSYMLLPVLARHLSQFECND